MFPRQQNPKVQASKGKQIDSFGQPTPRDAVFCIGDPARRSDRGGSVKTFVETDHAPDTFGCPPAQATRQIVRRRRKG